MYLVLARRPHGQRMGPDRPDPAGHDDWYGHVRAAPGADGGAGHVEPGRCRYRGSFEDACVGATGKDSVSGGYSVSLVSNSNRKLPTFRSRSALQLDGWPFSCGRGGGDRNVDEPLPTNRCSPETAPVRQASKDLPHLRACKTAWEAVREHECLRVVT